MKAVIVWLCGVPLFRVHVELGCQLQGEGTGQESHHLGPHTEVRGQTSKTAFQPVA